jgi:heat shock protein HspQ
MADVEFSVGQLIRHVRFGYRGVVFDVDLTFQGSNAWYDQVARSRPPKDQPWYHVLPDGAEHTTYVAERNLHADPEPRPLEHPMLDDLFAGFEDGRYQRRAVN